MSKVNQQPLQPTFSKEQSLDSAPHHTPLGPILHHQGPNIQHSSQGLHQNYHPNLAQNLHGPHSLFQGPHIWVPTITPYGTILILQVLKLFITLLFVIYIKLLFEFYSHTWPPWVLQHLGRRWDSQRLDQTHHFLHGDHGKETINPAIRTRCCPLCLYIWWTLKWT